jgi:hypothetical protein
MKPVEEQQALEAFVGTRKYRAKSVSPPPREVDQPEDAGPSRFVK